MAKPTKTTTGASKKKARAPAKGVPRAPNSTASRRSSRGQTSPLNPNRALQTQQEIAAADREQSDPEDTSTDSDPETETPNTRGGGRVSNQLAMPVKPMTELTTKEAERLRTEL